MRGTPLFFLKKQLTFRGKCAIINVLQKQYADMAELADAHGSGPCGGNFMQVRLLLSAPDNDNPNPVPIGDGFGFLVYL